MITANQTYEERVEALIELGADRTDAQAVVDAEDSVKQGMQPETNAFAMQMYRHDKLTQCKSRMINNILKRNCIVS